MKYSLCLLLFSATFSLLNTTLVSFASAEKPIQTLNYFQNRNVYLSRIDQYLSQAFPESSPTRTELDEVKRLFEEIKIAESQADYDALAEKIQALSEFFQTEMARNLGLSNHLSIIENTIRTSATPERVLLEQAFPGRELEQFFDNDTNYMYELLRSQINEGTFFSSYLANITSSYYEQLGHAGAAEREFESAINLYEMALYLIEQYMHVQSVEDSTMVFSLENRLRLFISNAHDALGTGPGAVVSLDESSSDLTSSLNQVRNEIALGNNPLLIENNLMILARLAMINIDNGSYQEASSIARNILSSTENSNLEFKRLLGEAFGKYILGKVNLEVGNYEIAVELFNRVREIIIASGSSSPSYQRIVLDDLALAYLYLGETSRADLLLSESVSLSQQGYESQLSFHYEALAMLEYDKGNYAQAEEYLQKLLNDSQSFLSLHSENHRRRIQARAFIGVIYWSSGKISDSVRVFENIIETVHESLNLSIYYGSDAQKVNYIRTMQRIIDPIISFDLQNNIYETDTAVLAFKGILERKGRALDFFAYNFGLLRQHLTPEDLALLEELNFIRDQISNLAFEVTSRAFFEERQAQIFQFQNQLADLERQLSQRFNELDSSFQDNTFESILELIPTNASLIEFVVYRPVKLGNKFGNIFDEPHYAAYVLQSNGTVHSVNLGSASEIDSLISDFQRVLRTPRAGLHEVQEIARALEGKIFSPLRSYIGNSEHVLISPDGALNLVPFEALVDVKNEYLIRNFTFTYLTSSRDILRLDSHSSPYQETVLLSNPNFENDGATTNSQEATRYTSLRSRIWTSLAGTQRETEAIADLIPNAVVFQGSQASEFNLKQINQPGILHIATHAFFESQSSDENFLSENPLLRSGLVLSGVNAASSGEGEDGVVSALEVSGLNLLGTQLVVLSACETGLGDLMVGEGVYGLRRALFLAGAESQVVSLWRVQDEATADLMETYYEHLVAGKGRSQALREAQLATLADERTSNPYYWAAFINSGNWRPLE